MGWSKGPGLASPRGEIQVKAGQALPQGFILILRVGGKDYRAEIGPNPSLERYEGGWINAFFNLDIPRSFHLPLGVLALIALAYGLTVWEKGLFALFVAIGALNAFLSRMDGTSRWHSLEHKSVWVLEGGIPQDLPALQRALAEAPPYDPRCGSVYMGFLALTAGALALLLPVSLALLLGHVLSEYLRRLPLPWGVIRLIQGPFLSPPKPEELEMAARGLHKIRVMLEKVPQEH